MKKRLPRLVRTWSDPYTGPPKHDVPPDSPVIMSRPAGAYAVGVTALATMLGASTPAWAHRAADTPAMFSAGLVVSSHLHGVTVFVSLLFGALVALIGLGLRRPRRLVWFLAILVLVLAFQAGFHAAHHMGGSDQCVVALATAHLVASPVEVVTVDPVTTPRLRDVLSTPAVQITRHRPVPHEGRAPPHSTV
jgi:hypothetical protein